MSNPFANRVILENESTTKYPILKDLYHFFSPRAKAITALSFGLDSLGIESHLISSTGCKITICDSRPGKEESYNYFLNILKTHTPIDSNNSWENQLSQRWILHKNFSFQTTIPYFFTGSVDLSGETIQCEKYKQERIDFCKIDYKEFNTHILYSLLNAGYRPGVLLVHWNRHPDQFTDSMLCAGHIQNSGYCLAGCENNWFLYVYIDNCLYESCSWARTDVANPMMDEIRAISITNLLNSTSNHVDKSNE